MNKMKTQQALFLLAFLSFYTPALAENPIAIKDLLRADGSLENTRHRAGVVEFSGYQVVLDPLRGPVFTPTAAAAPGWNALGSGIPDQTFAVAIQGTDVYVGGSFLNAGGNPDADFVARWDGNAWQALGAGVDNYVYRIAIQGPDVYVGGAFSSAGGDPNAAKIARWDGSAWHAFGTGLNYAVTAIAVDGSDVYVGGEFFDAGGNPDGDGIVRWDGSNWNALGSGLNWQVTEILIWNGEVYAGGLFTDAGGNPDGDYIARWDGSSWNPLGSGLNAPPWAIVAQGGDLYVGGEFTFAGGNPFANYIARWDGSNWQNLGYGAINERVNALIFYGPDLIAGGFFTDANGNPDADYIARWDGSNWYTLGPNLNSWIFRLATDGSAFYAAGDFTDAGGNIDADHVARWEDCSSSTFTVNILPVAPICNGQTVELTATDGVAWSWPTGETAVSIYVMPSSSETYTVTATDAIGCTASATMSVTVHPNPVATISGALFVCPGQTGTLTASGGQSYLWNTNAQTAGITVPDVEALYTVTVTDGNTCTATAAVTVTTTTTSSCAYLYGVTYKGGANNTGTIFRIKPDGTSHTIVHTFTSATGQYPQAGLTLLNGKLYGTTRYGGAHNKGVLFEFNPGNNVYTAKVHFDGVNGAEPRTPLTALNGQLYGVAYWGGSTNQGVLFEYTPGATLVTVHKNFDGSDGAYPEGTLKVFNNVLYGTTSGGGPYYGVLFEFNPAGNTYTVKHLFSGTPELNVPNGNLEVYGNKLYGTTYGGGNTYQGGLYEYDLTTGNYLKKVDLNGLNGSAPSVTGPVVYNGQLYGLTASGGTNGNGVLYRFDPSNGNYTKLQDFSPIDGVLPQGRLAVYNNKFYGATYYGGNTNQGVLFEFDPTGNIYQKRLDFNGTNGYGPQGDLTLVEGLWYADADADGYGNPAVFQISAAQPANYVCNNRDCNDNNAAAHPCATEICNSVDDDCDGQVDEGLVVGFNYTYNFTSVHHCDVLNITWTGGCAAWPVSLALIRVSPFVVAGSIVQNIPNTGSYTWTVPAGTAPGNYQLYIREGIQSLTWHYGPTFTVLPDATLITVPNATICAGQSATLTAGGSGSYNWSNLETSASITVTPAATTAYTVTVTNAGGCAVTASATITVLQPPVAAISGNLTFAAGGSTTLTVTGGAPYAWSTTSTDDVITVNAAGIYTVTVTGANGCTATTSVTVTETAPPLPPVFTKLYGDTDANVPDRVKIVDGHLYVAGHTRYTADPSLASFSKFDGAGNLVWDVRLDIPASIADFERLPDGSGFLLVGHTEPGVSGGVYQDNQVLIAKIDNSGDVVWLRTYQQLGREQMDRILLHPNPSNLLFPFYLTSRANYFSPPTDLTSVQLWNIDGAGAINWVKNYFLYDGNQFGRALVPLPNGDIWLLGNGDGSGVAVRVNGSGTTQETLDLAGIGTIYDAKRLPSGEIAVAGTTAFFDGQALVVKFDATMTPVWSKVFDGQDQTKATEIALDAQGNIYVLGQDASLDIETYQVLSRLSDQGADASLDWSRSLTGDFEEIENGYFFLDAAGNQIGYADARRGNPNNPGDWDNLVGLFDLDFSSSCLEEENTENLVDHTVTRYTNTLTETNRTVTLVDDRDGELPLPFICTNLCATEICDGLDNNFNGLIDEGFDQDNDGFSSCAGDCDDNDPAVHLGTAPNAAISYAAVPHIAYLDGAVGNRATVRKFDGANWVDVGTPGFSYGVALYTSLAFSGATPYLAYEDRDNGERAAVKKFDGTNWIDVGAPGFSGNDVWYTSLAFSGSTPYLAYGQGGFLKKPAVKKFDGVNWVDVGTPGFSVGRAVLIQLVFSGTTPYITFGDQGNYDQYMVKQFDGVDWVDVGNNTPGFSTPGAFSISLAFSGGQPWVAFRDGAYNGQLTVKQFDGANWQEVGTPGFAGGEVSNISLTFSGTTPYVAFRDGANNDKVRVMRFDGANWVDLGNQLFSIGEANYNNLVFSGNTPYLAYQDRGYPNWNATVFRLDGTNWVNVGAPQASAGISEDISLAFSQAAQTLCAGESTTLVASGGDFYNWSTGDNTATITVSPATTTTYTVTVSNGDGCTASASTTVTVNANQPPTLDGVPNDMTLAVECGDQLPYPYPVNAYDFFGNPLPVDYTEQILPGACPNQYTLVRNWSATDGNATCGNTTAFTQTITVHDNVDPVITAPADLSITCGMNAADIQAAIDDWLDNTIASDNCGTQPTVSHDFTGLPALDICTGGNHTVIWTATDGCGNMQTATAKIIVTPDTEAPVMNGLPTPASLSLFSTQALPDIPLVTASDNCAVPVDVEFSETIYPGVCPAPTVIVRSWTTTDACSNSAAYSQTITVSAAASISGNLNLCEGQSTTLTASGGGMYDWSTTASSAAIIVAPPGVSTYTVTVTDVYGCTAMASATVTVYPTPVAAISGDLSVCSGEATVLTATGGTAYAWSAGPTAAAITVDEGIYTVTVTGDAGCTATASAEVSELPLPAVQVSTNDPYCLYGDLTMTETGGDAAAWAWSGPNNFLAYQQSPVISQATEIWAGNNYSVTVTDANGCTNSTTFPINDFIPLTAISGVIPNQLVCPGSPTAAVNFSATIPGTIFSWTNDQPGIGMAAAGTGPIAPFTAVNSGSTPVTATITVTPVFMGCPGAPVSFTITVQGRGVITGNLSVCPAQSTTLTALGGGTYQWSTGSTQAAVQVSSASSTTYTVVVTGPTGCVSTASATVVAAPQPNAAISGTLSICNGSSTMLTASGGGTYQWSTGLTGAAITVAPTLNTAYTVTVTGANGCTKTVAATVIVLAKPPANISATQTTICAGKYTTLTCTGGNFRLWNTGQTASSITVAPTVTSYYSVTTFNNNGCVNSSTITITVNPAPPAGITGTTTICKGSSTTLSSQFAGSYTYKWSTLATTASITVTPLSTTTYTLTVTDGGGCTKSTTAVVTVNALPAAGISGTLSVCLGQSTTLTASGGGTYLWSTGATVPGITVTPTANTTYTVTVTNAAGCTKTVSATVTVKTVTPASISTFITTLCAGQSTSLTASSGSSRVWSTGATTATITVTPALTTTYTVTVTNSNGCTSSATKTITVNTPPTPANAGPAQTICSTGGATLAANTPVSGTGAWSMVSGPNTALSQFSSTTSPAATFTSTGGSGNYVLRWTVSNPPCASSTSNVTITVLPPPTTAHAGANQTVCPNTTASLGANTASSGTGAWSVVSGPSTALAQFSSTGNPAAVFTPAGGNGDYVLRWTISKPFCTASTSEVTVTVGPPAVPGGTIPNQVVCAGSLSTEIDFGTPPPGVAYNWTCDNPGIGLAAAGSGDIPAFTALNAGTTPQVATVTVTPVQLGGFAYIPNFGSNTVSVINTATNAVVATIGVGSYPVGVSASPDGSRVYVANSGSTTVSVINTATNTVVATVGGLVHPWGLRVSPDGSRVYVADHGSNTVSVINTATNTVEAAIVVGDTPYGVCVSPDGSKVYVSIEDEDIITVIDAMTNTVLTTIGTGIQPVGIDISPDGSRVYVANFISNTLSVINAAINSVVATIAVGSRPVGVSVSPDGTRVYVGNPNSSTVSVINTGSNTILTTIPGVADAWGTSVSPDGSKIYVTNVNAGTVSVINSASNIITGVVGVGYAPYGLGDFFAGPACTGAPITFTITVNPEMVQALCQDISVELNGDGEYLLAPEEIDDGSFAGSGPLTLSISPNLLTCDELGDTPVTLTATTPCGTASSCTATVTVTVQQPLLLGTAGGPGSQNGTVYRLSPDGSSFSNVHIFSSSPLQPVAPLFNLGDGYLYGTSRNGGGSFAGTVFRVLPDGTGLEMLHQFDNALGADPYSGLMSIGDGYLYGTTSLGGSSGEGTVYRLLPDGTGFQVIHSFDNTNGGNPASGLLSIGDGYLYGTTSSGGGMGYGAVYRLQPDGTNFSVVHAFDYTNGANPNAGLGSTGDGYLYGTTENGGSASEGTVYRLYPDGTGFQLLHEFDFFTGGTPYAGVIGRGDGYLYGTSRNGGANFAGTVYRVHTDGTGFQVLHNFNYSQGAAPYAGLSNIGDGFLYGTTYQGGSASDGTVYRLLPDGTGFQVLHSFQTGTSGAGPYAGLMHRGDGYLYGVTEEGGNNGTLYRIQPGGTNFQTLVQFNYNNLGANPYSKPTLGGDGYLYGTTQIGGAANAGTVYRVRPDGTDFRLLHQFDETNGATPEAAVILPGDGYLYGTARLANSGLAPGMVYRLHPDGTGFQVLHTFNYTDGQDPQSGLTWGGDGFLYGATFYGGSPGTTGRLYRLHPDGTGFQVIFNFNGANGSTPSSAPVLGGDGYLYGTAGSGGGPNRGLVYRIFPDGSGYQVLHTFSGTGGETPNTGLVLGGDGYLYGTTERGGNLSYGTVYRLHPDGTGFQALHHFDQTPHGAYPNAGLAMSADGYLYGGTLYGGTFGNGTLYRLLTDGTGFQVLRHFNGADAGQAYSPLVYVPGTDCSGGRPERRAAAQHPDEHGISVFPNPTTGVLYFRLSGFSGAAATIRVLNSLGQGVLERRLPVTSDQLETLDLGSVASGVYWVRVQAGDGQTAVTRRVVVARE